MLHERRRLRSGMRRWHLRWHRHLYRELTPGWDNDSHGRILIVPRAALVSLHFVFTIHSSCAAQHLCDGHRRGRALNVQGALSVLALSFGGITSTEEL